MAIEATYRRWYLANPPKNKNMLAQRYYHGFFKSGEFALLGFSNGHEEAFFHFGTFSIKDGS
jgi:hypothetical protein